jgi:hypothetical protein
MLCDVSHGVGESFPVHHVHSSGGDAVSPQTRRMTTMTNTQTNKALSDAELDTVVGGSLRNDFHNLVTDIRHPLTDGKVFFAGDVKQTVKDVLSFF